MGFLDLTESQHEGFVIPLWVSDWLGLTQRRDVPLSTEMSPLSLSSHPLFRGPFVRAASLIPGAVSGDAEGCPDTIERESVICR